MRNTDTLSGPTAQDTATKTYHLDESIATDLCLREGRGVTCPQSLSPRSGLQVPNGHFIVTLHGWHYPGLLGRVCGEPTNTGAWWPRKKHYKHEKTLSSVTLAMRLPLTAASILMGWDRSVWDPNRDTSPLNLQKEIRKYNLYTFAVSFSI